MGDYVLGTSDHELERLHLQQEVWGGLTARFLDALDVRPGARVLDVGCGPGFTVGMLRERVGAEGEVLGLDASERWIEHVAGTVREQGWTNVTLVHDRVQDAKLEPGSFDLAFLRWVLAFLPDPGDVLARVAHLVKPGGVVAVMDYNHEGVSVFPESEGFRAAVRACRDAYAAHGGDTWLMGRITGLFRRAGLETFHFDPVLIAGGPGSPAQRWMGAFFPFHSEGWAEEGLLTAAERELFLEEWAARVADPDALFFSPIVVGAAARRP